ncbi:purple acid phosphatase 15 [Perilla frutescens var. frutescens]|nr:purple acid phosphatase 15 [Perilla frutescens var. frutescens]
MALKIWKMVVAVFIFLFLNLFQVYCEIPTTLEGPFDPVTVSLDENFRGNAIDLPDSDPRVQRDVTGFEPEQISVSLSSTHDSVWISWITGEFQIGVDIKPLDPKSVASVVYYGKLRFPMLHKATGESLIYKSTLSFQWTPELHFWNHSSCPSNRYGLDPYSLYYYKVGDPSIPAMSHIHHFKTMPVSSVQSYPARVAVVGDLGLTYNSTSTIEHMTSNKPDLVLMVGDLCYANLYLTNGTGSDCYSCSFPNTPIHETYQPRWDYWGRFMQPLTSKIPIMMVQGNHEIEEQVDNRTFTSFISRFAFPHEESGSSSPFYYSFNAGGIHFVVLGGYVAYSRSDDQYKWLQKDLANVDRDSPCWDGGNREKMATTHADEPGNCPEPSSTAYEFMGGFCAPLLHQDQRLAISFAIYSQVKNETHALWSWHRNQDMYNEVGDQIYIVRQPEKCPVQPKMIKKLSKKVIGDKTVCCSKFLQPLGRGESGITGPVPGVSPPPPPYRGVVPDGGSGGVIALGVVVPAVVPPDETIPPAELQNGEKRAI